MRFLLLLLVIAALSSCTQSEGKKYAILQKISHKTGGACDYYVAEFAYEGGRVETTGSADGKSTSNAYSNTQEITITKEAADTLESYIGDKVIFDYQDRGGIHWCEEAKILTYIKRK